MRLPDKMTIIRNIVVTVILLVSWQHQVVKASTTVTAPTAEITDPSTSVPDATTGEPQSSASPASETTREPGPSTSPGEFTTDNSTGPIDEETSPGTTETPTTEGPPEPTEAPTAACTDDDLPMGSDTNFELVEIKLASECSPDTLFVDPIQFNVVSYKDEGYGNNTCFITQCPSGSLFDGSCCFNQNWIIGFAAGIGGFLILLLIIIIIVMACTRPPAPAKAAAPAHVDGYQDTPFNDMTPMPAVTRGVTGDDLIADAERGLRDSQTPNGYIDSDDRYTKDPTGRGEYEEPRFDEQSARRPAAPPPTDFEEIRKNTGYDDRRREYPDDRDDRGRYDDRDSYDDRRDDKRQQRRDTAYPPPKQERYDDRDRDRDRDRYDDRRDDRYDDRRDDRRNRYDDDRYDDGPSRKRDSYREDRRDDYRKQDDRRREDDRSRGYDNKGYQDSYRRKDVNVIRKELEEKSMDEIKRSSAYINFEPQLENIDTRPVEFKRPNVGKGGKDTRNSRNSYGAGIYDDVYPTDRR